MDVAIYESGSGGEFRLLGNDLDGTSGLYNQVYLALFGGNTEASTARDMSAPRSDWWGNALLLQDAAQFNSETERTLRNTALTSSGRAAIERAVRKDLQYLDIPNEVAVSVTSHNKVVIEVRLLQEGEKYKFVWDSARDELINEVTI